MSSIVANFKFFEKWEKATDADKKALLNALRVVKGRYINSIVQQALTNSQSINSQIGETRNKLEEVISNLEAEIEKIEEKENMAPVLETPPDAPLDLSIAAQKVERERLERETNDRNETIKAQAEATRKKLEKRRRLLQSSLERVHKLGESFEKDFPSFMKTLCEPEDYKYIKDALVNRLALNMASGYNSMESVGKDGERVFNHSGDATSTGYSINEEAARKFIAAMDNEAAVEIAADLARANLELEKCEHQRKELEDKKEKLSVIDTFSENDLSSVSETVRLIRENAQELISNSTAIVNSGTISKFMSRIRQLFSIEGKDEKRNHELVSKLHDIARAHMEKCENDPNYDKAVDFYRESLATYKEEGAFPHVKIGEDAMKQSMNYFKSSLLQKDLETVESDDQTIDALKQLIEMACLSENSRRTDEAMNVPQKDYELRKAEKESLPQIQKRLANELEVAQSHHDIAQGNVDRSSEAKEIFENNSSKVIINWADKYLNMTARYDIHAPAALLALRAIVGIDDEEIISSLLNVDTDKVGNYIKSSEEKVEDVLKNFRSKVDHAIDQEKE